MLSVCRISRGAQQVAEVPICLPGLSRGLAEALDMNAAFFVQGQILVFSESSLAPCDARELSHEKQKQRYES